MTDAARRSGKLKHYDDAKGYGFIRPFTPLPEKKDVFFHRTRCGYVPTVQGESVSFVLIQTERGPQAVDIMVEVITRP